MTRDISYFELINWGKQKYSPDAVGIITVAQFLQNISQPNPRFISAIKAQLFELVSALEHSLEDQGMLSRPGFASTPNWITCLFGGMVGLHLAAIVCGSSF